MRRTTNLQNAAKFTSHTIPYVSIALFSGTCTLRIQAAVQVSIEKKTYTFDKVFSSASTQVIKLLRMRFSCYDPSVGVIFSQDEIYENCAAPLLDGSSLVTMPRFLLTVRLDLARRSQWVQPEAPLETKVTEASFRA